MIINEEELQLLLISISFFQYIYYFIILSRRPPYFKNTGANTRATMVISLISMFIAGPAVSLKGSPTVSPITAAAWDGLPLPPWALVSIYFFALSHASSRCPGLPCSPLLQGIRQIKGLSHRLWVQGSVNCYSFISPLSIK